MDGRGCGKWSRDRVWMDERGCGVEIEYGWKRLWSRDRVRMEEVVE